MGTGTLDGRVALITGSARGLGRAIAMGYLAEGCRVVVTDIDDAPLTETGDLIVAAGHGDNVILEQADITLPDDVDRLTKTAVERFGHLDILVNNAGVGQEMIRQDFLSNPVRMWEVPVDLWRRVFDINAIAPFLTVRAAVPHMVTQGWGRVINVTTSLDTMIRGGFAPYGGSKAANEAHTAVLAHDLDGTGITANVLIPGGPADTRMFPNDAQFDRATLVKPEQMAAPAIWLASDAAKDVTNVRLVAAQWDPGVPAAQAFEKAAAPIAWASLGHQTIWPDGQDRPSL